MVFVSIRLYWDSFTPRLLEIITYFNFFSLIIHRLFPAEFKSLAIFFVRDIKMDDFTGRARGASGFAAEPAFTAAMFSIILLAWIWFYNNKDISFRKFVFFSSLSFLAIILTQASTGTLSLIILLFFYIIFNVRPINFFLSVSVLLCLIFFFEDILKENRAGHLVWLLIENPTTFFIIDTSIGERVSGIFGSCFY